MPEAEGDGAGHFAQDHRLVGGPQVELRGDRHLILAKRIFGEEGVGRRARPPDRGDEDLAERPLIAEGITAIGGARPVTDARIDEFLLEGREDLESGLRAERLEAALQEAAQASTAKPRLQRSRYQRGRSARARIPQTRHRPWSRGPG